MVGIPGKSKGCHTCRKRKIRCDLQKPDCARCLQSGRTCEGYNRGAVFLNRTAQGWAKRERLEEAQPRDTRQNRPYVPYVPPKTGTGPTSQSRSVEVRPVYRFAVQLSDAGPKKQMFQGLFMESYLPPSKQGSGLASNWLLEATRLNKPGPALEFSLHALCVTRVGRITDHQELVKQGTAAYGIALRALFTALESPKLAGRDETLTACLILSIYELFESTSDSTSAHEGHMRGVERLVQYRGRRQTETALGKALLKNICYGAMIRSLQYRKTSRLKSIVDQTEWWDMQGKLFAKGHVLGALLDDLDQYKNSGKHSLSASAEYLKRCVQLDAKFEDWYDELVAESPSPIYWICNPETKREGKISFATLSLAHLVLDFWALRLILTTTISIICSQVPQEVPITFRYMLTQLDDEHGSARQVQLATNIMESMPFCMRDEYGISSSQKCLFPGRVALYALRRHPSEQLAKYERMFNDLSVKKGLRFAQDIDKQEMKVWTPLLAEKAEKAESLEKVVKSEKG